MTRLFFSAGESSGDIHGANLIRSLRDLDSSVVCEGVGGTHMAGVGMALRHDLASRAIMGFSEVVRSFGWIRRVFHDCAAHIERTRPDAVVLIDYPGFNMRLAQRAKAAGVPVIYYISPQVWAWRSSRVYTLARLVDKMLVIFPFEERLYRDAGVDCTFVGHPLLDHIAAWREGRPSASVSGNRQSEVVGLLPGSREQEVARLMPTMVEAAAGIRQRFPDVRFAVPCVSDTRERQVRALAEGFPLDTVVGKTYDVLESARFCLVASGTATLETALFGVPMAILYRTSPVNYWIARRLVRIRHIGLVNIVAGRGIVPEFIQDEAAAAAILPVALDLMTDTPRRAQMLSDLAEVRNALGSPGASMRAAREILRVAGRTAHA